MNFLLGKNLKKIFQMLPLIFLTTLSAKLPQSINEWQFVDKRSGLVFPWFTKPMLDTLVTWDVKDWEVFEWGAGYSTIWFSFNCKNVVSADTNKLWTNTLANELDSMGQKNVILKIRDTNELNASIGDGGENSDFVNSIDENDKLYDCIVIDGAYHRNACAVVALNHIKDNGIIILDNANQASIHLNSIPTFELLKNYEHYSYLQPGHQDWRTDFWIIRK